ncbi:MAG TPA: hypothetical protein VEA38_10225 [Terriglobales bacterium]|nr:hypothetical protein [Terriglobales bacterium]
MTQTPFTLRRWSRLDYDRLVELGAFEGEAVELIGGQFIRSPRPSPTWPSSEGRARRRA